jgi:hemolysin-activating ACP:hemolysin acyltransferase
MKRELMTQWQQTLEDWHSGQTVRVIAMIAPFGGEVRL